MLAEQQQMRSMNSMPAAMITLAKVAFQRSEGTFVVNEIFILCINICRQNRHLRQAPNRMRLA